MTHTPNHIDFQYRKFTLDGEPCDIEDFISSHATNFDEAHILREDLAELQVDCRMYIYDRPTEREIYRVS